MGKVRYPGNLLRAVVLAPLAVVVFSGVAQADPQFPPRKPGLWENKLSMGDMSNQSAPAGSPQMPSQMTMFSCVDPASELKLDKRMAAGEPGCTQPEWSGGGNQYTFAESCTENGATTNTTGTVTYLNDEHIVSDTSMSGTGMNRHMHADAQWAGSCPAGMAPGDFGMVMGGSFMKQGNVNNLP
jgi:hypothetical protein